MIEFEFDPDKDAANLAKHGIDFTEAQGIWTVPNVVSRAACVKGEERWGIVGKLRGVLYVAIYAMRGDRIRIVSCHRADAKWSRLYANKILN